MVAWDGTETVSCCFPSVSGWGGVSQPKPLKIICTFCPIDVTEVTGVLAFQCHCAICISGMTRAVRCFRLGRVYVKASSDVKRIILRLMEAPIKQMGMESKELLHFIKNCPRGSETLVSNHHRHISMESE